jgi:hypothetical protein
LLLAFARGKQVRMTFGKHTNKAAKCRRTAVASMANTCG